MSARAWARGRPSSATWPTRVGWWTLALSTACCSSPLDPERAAPSSSGSGRGAAPPAGPSLTWPEPPPRPSAAATLTAAVEPPPPPSSSALRRERSSSETRPAHRLALSPDGARFVALVGDVLGSGPGPVLVHGDTATLGSKPVARRLDGLVRGLAIADDGALALGLVDALVLLEGGRERVVSDVDAELFAFDARGALVIATREGLVRLERGAARPTVVVRLAAQSPVALAPGARALLSLRGEAEPTLAGASLPGFVTWLEGEASQRALELPEPRDLPAAPPSEAALDATGHAVLLAGSRVLRASLSRRARAELVMTLDFVPSRPSLSPDGRLLAVRDASYRTRVIDLEARGELAHVAEVVEQAVWLPSSRALVGATSRGLATWQVR